MSRYRVDPRTVKVVQMKDGTRYRPSKDGYVGVAARHVAEMESSGARASHAGEAQIGGIALAVPDAAERPCPTCGWTGWAWSTVCGRCGEALDAS